MKTLLLSFVLLCLCGARAIPARAYLVGPALTLDELNAQADVVFKGVALETAPVEDDDEFLPDMPGFVAVQTRFRVVSVLQEEIRETEIAFLHYTPESSQGAVYQPQYYKFEEGRAYLVWAKRAGGHWRQTRRSHTMRADQGVLLCADETPRIGSVKEVVWSELVGLLHNQSPDDVGYAIRHLSAMSSKSWGKAADFERDKVLPLIAPFFFSPHEEVALAALDTVRLEVAPFQNELMEIVSGDAPLKVKAAAFANLSGIKTPAVEAFVNRFLKRSDRANAPELNYWALYTLGLFPGDDARHSWRRFATSPHGREREGVAGGIGRTKDALMLRVLDGLLDDVDADVKRTAAQELLRFPANDAKEWWKRHRQNPDFRPVFTLALAKSEMTPYVNGLAEILTKKQRPRLDNLHFDGSNPLYVAWHLLYDYAQKQPRTAFQNGAMNPILSALENDGPWSSSEPEQLYRLLREAGLEKRAATFRAAREKSAGYDISFYFNRADRYLKEKISY